MDEYANEVKSLTNEQLIMRALFRLLEVADLRGIDGVTSAADRALRRELWERSTLGDEQ